MQRVTAKIPLRFDAVRLAFDAIRLPLDCNLTSNDSSMALERHSNGRRIEVVIPLPKESPES